MDVKIFERAQSTIEMVVEVTQEDLKEFEPEALHHLSATLNVPGFRPGKVPESIARRHIDPLKLLEDTANHAIPQLYGRAVKKNNLETIGQPKIEIVKFAPGNPLVFKATVAVLPEFEIPDYKKLSLKHEPAKIDDQQVDRFLRQLQRSRATDVVVQRAAAKGDVVEVDFDITRNKVPIENGQGRKHPVVIGEGAFIPGFEDQLLGMEVGKEKTFDLTFPASYAKKDLAGKPATFKVKMLTVKERKLPPLDDAFAKNLGAFKDINDLKAKLNENLKLDAELKEQERFESELLTTLATKTKLEVPDVLLQGELDKMSRELEQSLARQGANLQDYLSSLKKSLEELRKGWVEQATKRVKIGLIIRKIAKLEKVEVSAKELEDELNNTLKQNPGNKEVIKTVKNPAYQDFVKEVVRNRKTIKLLSSLAEGTKPAQA
jgi:trigger factor